MPSTNCLRCNGSGQWVNPRNSADIRPCFGCQTAPRFYYRRRAAAAPAIAPVAPAAPVAFDAASLTGNDARFYAAHPAEFRWLFDNAAGNEFAASVLQGMRRYGGLTPRQMAAVQRNVARDAERAAPLPVPPPVADDAIAATLAAAPVEIRFDTTRIQAALDAAAASGLRKVRLTFGSMELRLSGSTFRRGAGLILVYFNADGANNPRQRFGSADYLGYLDRSGCLVKSARVAELPSAASDMLSAICADPAAASRTFGHDTGHCACCRRLLTDPPSVMAGIGPVCAERFGFSF